MIDPQSLTKRYYKIGEVAKMFDVATSLIRYWEGEFDLLKPQKNAKGVRRYLKEDVLIVDRIYDLVKVKGYKLDGAKKELKENPKPRSSSAQLSSNSVTNTTNLSSIKSELQNIREGLLKIKEELKSNYSSDHSQ